MRGGAAADESVSALDAAEFVLRRNLSRADATPFLAHCDLVESDRVRFSASFRAFLRGDAARILDALRRWPLVSVWNFAAALSQIYGEDGHAVYAVLDRTFCVDIIADVRNNISRSFRLVCRKYELCYDGSGRWVNDYLAQAGIANSQLHHVAKAFLFAERAFGPPPYDNTAALNSWEDDAVHFLPAGVNVPRMVLEVDQSAHYAFLFARYRQQEAPRNEFEKLFFDEIEKAQNAIIGGHERSQTVPRPSLIWSQSGLALALPKVEGRLSISISGVARKLRGGQNWPLPTPWPDNIHWGFGGHSERLPIFLSAQNVLAFEIELGRLAGKFDPGRDAAFVVDGREVMVVAKYPFSVDGEPAVAVGLGGYACHCLLGPKGAAIALGSQTVRITAKPKPRIWIEGGTVAKGPKGFLLSGRSSLGIEFGELDNAAFDLALTIDGREAVIPLTVAPDVHSASYDLSTQLVSGADLVAVKAELRLRGSSRALVRYKAWLWADLRELKDGLVFDSDRLPSNYSAEYSRHVVVDQASRLCLDAEAAYETARLTFLVSNERIDFDIPRPGISLSFTDVEGRSLPLKIGETLIVRDEDKGGSLRVRCPDGRATLNVRGRSEVHAFKHTATRVLSLADLIAPAPRDDITIEGPTGASVPIVLARIVPAAAPIAFLIERRRETLSLRLELQIDVDAIRFSLEDEIGRREDYDCALGHRPVPQSMPNWLNATLDSENPRRVQATVNVKEFGGDFSLVSLAVRPTGTDSFRALRNLRGDNYAIVVSPSAVQDPGELELSSGAKQRFITLNAWMCQCFSQESWGHISNLIVPRWMSIGKMLAKTPEGPGLLLSCSQVPPRPGAAKNWVPLAHPLQILASLYASPVTSFQSLAASGSDGPEDLALLAETSARSIPEIHKAIGLSPAFLMAFENFALALKANKPLQGFNFERYRQLFQQLDTNPGARWFWKPGDELLGPAHYGAALGRMMDRFYDAGLEEEGSNDARIRAATSIAHAASRAPEKTLPPPLGIELTHGVFEFAPSFVSGFARSSRMGSVAEYLTRIAGTLERPYRSLIGDASFIIRLAPELLAFYLLLWELGSERHSA
jgi:uncharacterized Zn-binding protein involved in type VI secretion